MAVYGALVVLQALIQIYWIGGTWVATDTVGLSDGTGLAIVGGFTLLLTLPVLVYGYTEAALACLAAGATGILLAAVVFPYFEALPLAMLVFGGVVMLLGLSRAEIISRRLAEDEDSEEEPPPEPAF